MLKRRAGSSYGWTANTQTGNWYGAGGPKGGKRRLCHGKGHAKMCVKLAGAIEEYCDAKGLSRASYPKYVKPGSKQRVRRAYNPPLKGNRRRVVNAYNPPATVQLFDTQTGQRLGAAPATAGPKFVINENAEEEEGFYY